MRKEAMHFDRTETKSTSEEGEEKKKVSMPAMEFKKLLGITATL